MNIAEIEAALREYQNELKLLRVDVKHLRDLASLEGRHREDLFVAQQTADGHSLGLAMRGEAQFSALREMLFDLAEKTGFSRDQTEAEFDRRWQKLLVS
jgi:hypothetical protein